MNDMVDTQHEAPAASGPGIVPDSGRGVALITAVTPLTTAVLAAVPDDDLGEAAAINDAAAGLGSLGAVAPIPVVIGVTGQSGYGQALGHGFQPAMLGLAATRLGAALVSGLFVSDARRGARLPRAHHPHASTSPVTSAAAITRRASS